jgi:hypothetical protein
MQTQQDGVPMSRAIDCDVPLKSQCGGSTSQIGALALALACTVIARPACASQQASSFPEIPVQAQIAAAFEGIEQPALDGSHPAAPFTFQESAARCGGLGRNADPGTICFVLGWPHARLAQRDGFQVEEISSPSGRVVPIRITLPNEVRQPDAAGQKPAFLMLRGLPPEITLSAGFRLRDAWAVSLRDAPDLTMNPPPGYQGSYMLTVTLHNGQDTNPETRMISVRLGPPAAQDGAARTQPIQPTSTAAPNAEPDTITASITDSVEGLGDDEETSLLENASEMLKAGDIEAARLVYSELSAHGSGKAAFLMARTYDPQVLEDHFLVGLQPDFELARQWYNRAAELGDSDAKERLSKLQIR